MLFYDKLAPYNNNLKNNNDMRARARRLYNAVMQVLNELGSGAGYALKH